MGLCEEICAEIVNINGHLRVSMKYCGAAVLYPVKICHFHWFNKIWLASNQAGSISKVTRIKELWEEERLSL